MAHSLIGKDMTEKQAIRKALDKIWPIGTFGVRRVLACERWGSIPLRGR
jgi:hypothetical protein